jgi:cytochrome bd-type quinol oxidase subunit 1
LGHVRSASAGLFPDLLVALCDRFVQDNQKGLPTMRKPSTSVLKATALTCFGGYCVWNACFIVSGQLPDSIWRAVTGLPCPTTGGTRSVQAYLRGDWEAGFWYNPLAPVFLMLLLVSAALLFTQRIRRQEPRLSSWLARIWLWSLLLAWIAKLLIGPNYW